MDNLFEDNKLVFVANPQFNDSFHNFILYKDNTFEFCDECDHVIDAIYTGTYEIKNSQIIFTILEQKDPYSNNKTSINITNVVNYRLLEEQKDHFDGFFVKRSSHTLHIDKSPFKLNGDESIIDTKKGNLFNILQDEEFPTIFYTGIEKLKNVDIEYYRARDWYKNLIEHIIETEEYPTIFKAKALEANGMQYLEKYSKITKEMLNQRLVYSVLLYVSSEEIVFTIDKYTLIYVNDKNVCIYAYERPNIRNEDIYKKLKTLDLDKDLEEINERVFNWKNGLFTMKDFLNFKFHSI
jgi:hypothetical protein